MTANQRDPFARLDDAVRLARAGQYAEALDAYVWCFDEGMVERPEFSSVRLSLLLDYWRQLAEEHPPAAAELEARRNSAEAETLTGRADQETLETMAALNKRLLSPLRLLGIFEQLGAGRFAQRQTQKRLLPLVLEHLIIRQQYQQIVDVAEDVLAAAGEALGAYLALADAIAAAKGDAGPSARLALARRNMLETVGAYYEAALGLGLEAQAAQIGERLLSAAPDDSGGYLVLAGRAAKLQHNDVARGFLERALAAAPEQDRAQLRAALASLS